ncbi:response regulator transcription factor [Actinacidiphila sp. bgisy145]|uniref:response regulator transcription factor n=1 Tax=Actinacidiphila sp. bgisy145 TaxID=3413792 RepID=UPI003EBD851A
MASADLLVVEDDTDIATELVRALTGHGYRADLARSGAQALSHVLDHRPDLVLLDLGLPDIDGVALCRRLRALLPVESVIVVLTARTQEFEVVVALDAGADDYLTKPFRCTELLARLRAHLRRREAASGPPVIRLGRVRIDTRARRLHVADREVLLRPKEFDLLAALAEHAGAVVPREELMSRVWDEHWFGPTKTLDVHVSALRRKIADAAPDEGPVITTVRGRGYRYEPPPPPSPAGDFAPVTAWLPSSAGSEGSSEGTSEGT